MKINFGFELLTINKWYWTSSFIFAIITFSTYEEEYSERSLFRIERCHEQGLFRIDFLFLKKEWYIN
jgi:hypothetical protein